MDEHSTSRSRRRRRFSLAGMLVLTVGVVLLLNTTGVMTPGVWLELWTYWPVLLVLLGVSILLGRRAPIVCTGVVGLALAGTVFAAHMTDRQNQADDLWAVNFATPVSDTQKLQLNLEFIGGAVNLAADWNANDTDPRLLAADFNGSRAIVDQTRSGDLTQIDLTTEFLGFHVGSDRTPVFGDNMRWDLMMSSDVAASIDIKAGAADLDLDLSELDVDWLTIGAGASDIRVWLPTNAGLTRVVIDAGAADIEIVVPQGVAVRVDNDTFLSSTRIDSARFPRIDGVHQSPGFSIAQNRVTIEIDAAASDLTVS